MAQLWDTAGQEKFRAVTNMYYRNAHGALIVYDITEKDTFTNAINTWLPELRQHTDPPGVPVILIGNKCDKLQQRAVSTEEAKRTAEEKGLSFLETSAMDASNVEQAFQSTIVEIYNSV